MTPSSVSKAGQSFHTLFHPTSLMHYELGSFSLWLMYLSPNDLSCECFIRRDSNLISSLCKEPPKAS